MVDAIVDQDQSIFYSIQVIKKVKYQMFETRILNPLTIELNNPEMEHFCNELLTKILFLFTLESNKDFLIGLFDLLSSLKIHE